MPRLLFAILALVGAQRTSADILHVPAEFPTIQAAIDAAHDSDEIVLEAGACQHAALTFGRGLSQPGRATLPGASGRREGM